MSYPRRRRHVVAALVALLTLGAGALVATAPRASAQGLPRADLEVRIESFVPNGRANGMATISVTNRGPDSLAFGDFELLLEWSPGPTKHPNDVCRSQSDNACVLDGGPLRFEADSPTGPRRGRQEFRLTLVGRITDGALFASVVDTNYTQTRARAPQLILFTLPVR